MQSFTPVPGSTLHLGGVGKNRIGKGGSTARPAEQALTLETGSPDPFANMSTFTAAALDLLMEAMDGANQ
jgi:hypothetical protein